MNCISINKKATPEFVCPSYLDKKQDFSPGLLGRAVGEGLATVTPQTQPDMPYPVCPTPNTDRAIPGHTPCLRHHLAVPYSPLLGHLQPSPATAGPGSPRHGHTALGTCGPPAGRGETGEHSDLHVWALWARHSPWHYPWKPSPGLAGLVTQAAVTRTCHTCIQEALCASCLGCRL